MADLCQTKGEDDPDAGLPGRGGGRTDDDLSKSKLKALPRQDNKEIPTKKTQEKRDRPKDEEDVEPRQGLTG